MNPRLRVLFVAPEKRLLVIDRMGNVSREQAETMLAGTKTPATDGTLVFPFDVDIPDGDEGGTKIHTDEHTALRAAVSILRNNADLLATGDQDWARDVAGTLDLLLIRIEEAL